jgi:membrane protein implicated in regulation of membrane protease activity
MEQFWEVLRDNMWGTWLGLAMLLGALELASLDLFLLMMAAGCLVGMVAALAGAGVPVQILLAAGSSVAMLALVRPSVIRRMHSGPELRHGPAALVGQEGFALAEITSRGGQAKLGGEVWTARPYDDHAVIPSGARVQVLQIRGATAYVAEVPQLGA